MYKIQLLIYKIILLYNIMEKYPYNNDNINKDTLDLINKTNAGKILGGKNERYNR